MKFLRFLVPAAAVAVLASSAYAGPVSVVTIQVDENGNGTISDLTQSDPLAHGLQTDPGPGGLSSVLTYSLFNPPGLTTGDVTLYEAGNPPSHYEDVIRFNGDETCDNTTGCLVFYSAPGLSGFDSLADTPVAPTLYANTVALVENESGYTTYTPSAGQPGFVSGANVQVTYEFLSDTSNVPEPATLAVFGAGLAGFAAFRRRKSNKA